MVKPKASELVLLELRQVSKTQDEQSKVLAALNREAAATTERTQNIWRLTEKQEDHLAKLNDRTSTNTKDIARVDEKTGTSKKAIAGYSGGGLVVIVIAVLQILQAING